MKKEILKEQIKTLISEREALKDGLIALRKRIDTMENEVYISKVQYIGEACVRTKEEVRYFFGNYFFKRYFFGNYFFKWRKFQQKDIQDKVNNKIKIFDVWYSKKDVLMYVDFDIYQKQRNKIQKRKEKHG